MKSIESRLVRLERVRADPFTDVLSWIAAHRLYSDLTEAERDRYAQYQGVNRQAIEDCLLAALGSLDDPLSKRTPKPSQQELNSIIDLLEIQILQNERND